MLKRKKLLDHFSVIVCDPGTEPRVVERWPPTDAESSYELPPALPFFATETTSRTSPKTAVRKRWFARNQPSAASGTGNDGQSERAARFHPFVLTGASGERIYGASLLRGGSAGSSVHALCFLSRFPFFSLFHDVLLHLHHLSTMPLPALKGSSGSGGGSSGGASSSGKEKSSKRRDPSSSSAPANGPSDASAIAIMAAAASRADGAGDTFLQVCLGRGPLGLGFANFQAWDGRSRLCVIHVQLGGQAEAAGVRVGDEIVELNGEPVKPGTHHYELRQHIVDARGPEGEGRTLVMLFKAENSSGARLRALPTTTFADGAATVAAVTAKSGSAGDASLPLDAGGLPRASPHSLERLVPHLMAEMRLPSSGGVVEATLGPGPRNVRYIRSATGAMPRVEDASFGILWRLLSVPSVVAIVEALTTEQRVILIADDVSLLAPVGEALLRLPRRTALSLTESSSRAFQPISVLPYRQLPLPAAVDARLHSAASSGAPHVPRGDDGT